MSDWKSKRFWQDATVDEGAEGFSVLLDGRPIKTPAKAPLHLPSAKLASAIAAEWQAQEETIDPASMPMTRAANSAIDKVVSQFDEVAGLIAAYGDADLICYRAAYPDGLVARQAAAWDSLVDWAATELGAPLKIVSGVMHEPQASASLAALSTRVRAFTPFALAGFHDLVSLSGSLIIGFAAAKSWENPASLWERSRVDEHWQIDEWGEDEEANQAATAKLQSFLDAERFFQMAQFGT